MLTQQEKEKIVIAYQAKDGDTGSPEVQIALLSEEINRLLSHLKTHPKDVHSKRGLLQMVAQRRSHLRYLKREDTRRYNALVKKVGLKR